MIGNGASGPSLEARKSAHLRMTAECAASNYPSTRNALRNNFPVGPVGIWSIQ
jgi:hypothetical protein